MKIEKHLICQITDTHQEPSSSKKYIISTRDCFKYMFKAFTEVCFFIVKPSL